MSTTYLEIPSASEVDASAPPIIGILMRLAATLVRKQCDTLFPHAFENVLSVAEDIGAIFGEQSLAKLLVLRALAERAEAFSALVKKVRKNASSMGASERSRIMGALTRIMPKIRGGIDETAKEVAEALNVPIPDQLRPGTEGFIAINIISNLYRRSSALVTTDDPAISSFRDLARFFNEQELLENIAQFGVTRNRAAIVNLIPQFLERVNAEIQQFTRAHDDRDTLLSFAKELDSAAIHLEKVFSHKLGGIVRRAELLRRHLRDELNVLVEDAVDEFEVDFRRMAEKKGWFGSSSTGDLNERLVIKNLHRRYKVLAQRYQEQLDLLEREVAEQCDEIYKLSDEAFRPMARFEFRRIAPKPSLELRVKAAADRASNRAIVTGAITASASGAAVHAGIITATALAGVAMAPVGVAILGSIAVASIWKAFASPTERNRRDPRERALNLESSLRKEVLTNLPRFEAQLDAVILRYREAATPDIIQSKTEASRIRQTAQVFYSMSDSITNDMKARVKVLSEFTSSI